MPVNPRSTLLIKPGDPSDVYQIGNMRIADLNQAPRNPTTGSDVKQWHSVIYALYNNTNDPGLFIVMPPYPKLFYVVWRYYDSASPVVLPGVGGAGAADAFAGRGMWVRGETGWLGIATTTMTYPEKSYIVIPTYNCDRIYVEHCQWSDGSLVSPLTWVSCALYGITPRSTDGTIPPVVVGPGFGASGQDDTKCTVYDATGAGAISLTATTGLWTDYELISVMCHFSVAPVLAGALTVVRNKTGAPYDTVLYSVDPSVMGLTNIVYSPKTRFNIDAGDTIVVSYANPSAVTYGVEVVTRTTTSV